MREQIEEFNAVENLARKFIEAVKNGNSEIVKPYFYEKANFFGQLNEKEYQSGSIQGFYDTIDKMGACGDDYVARVDVITLEKTIAAVRVIEDFLVSEMPVIASRYWNMVHGWTPDDVKQDFEGLQTMRILGKNMAWFLKMKEVSEKSGLNMPLAEEPVFTNFIK